MRRLFAFLQLFGDVEILIDDRNEKLYENNFEGEVSTSEWKITIFLQFAKRNHIEKNKATRADCPRGISASAAAYMTSVQFSDDRT